MKFSGLSGVCWGAVIITFLLGLLALTGSIYIGFSAGQWTRFMNIVFGSAGAALLVASGIIATLAVKHEQSVESFEMEKRLQGTIQTQGNAEGQGEEH